MAETDTSPPVTATSAGSIKRERGSSPEHEQGSDSSSTKRAKAENGDAVPVVPEVKEETKDQESKPVSASAEATTENGNGHPAPTPKMSDDKTEG